MANFKRILPLLNRVVIQKIEAAKQTSSGIILPETGERDLTTGKVIAVGPGEKFTDGNTRTCLVEEGQTVLLPMYGGQPVWLNKEKYYVYKDTELVSILKD